ncbi:MAG: hypothetical protein GY953_36605, partial [bacterium]|nr:hypothetical protein [bacterium]
GAIGIPLYLCRTLSITFYGANPAISYTVEASTDLQTWDSEGVILSALNPYDLRTGSVAADASRRFLRLVVAEE